MTPHPAQVALAFAEAIALHERLIREAMAAEVAARRPYWIAGVPTELDLAAARKAVAHRLKTTPDTVAAVLAKAEAPAKEDV